MITLLEQILTRRLVCNTISSNKKTENMNNERARFEKCEEGSDHGHIIFDKDAGMATGFYCKEHALSALEHLINDDYVDEMYKLAITEEINASNLPDTATLEVRKKVVKQAEVYRSLKQAFLSHEAFDKKGFGKN